MPQNIDMHELLRSLDTVIVELIDIRDHFVTADEPKPAGEVVKLFDVEEG